MKVSDQINKCYRGIISKLKRAEKRVIEFEKDFKEHEKILKEELERVEEEKTS